MSDLRKTLQKLDEMTAGATGGGAIAPSMGAGNGFANGGPGTKKRLEEVDLEELNVGKQGKKSEWMKTEKEKRESPSLGTPSGWGMWSNSPQKTAKQTKVKSMKVVEGKKKIDEADLEEEKLEPKNKKPTVDAIGKKKLDKRDIGKKPVDKDILPKTINEGVEEAEAVFKKVRNITSDIKRGVDPREIMTQVQMLADEHGIDISYEIGDVYEKMKELESAVYSLDEPFEYAFKQAQWKHEEENEPLDEISDKLRNKYVDRATSDYSHANFGARSSKSHPGLEDYHKEQTKRASKRAKGLSRALSDKRLGREKVDEVSRETLQSYQAKASDAKKHKDMPTDKKDKRYAGVAKASSKLDKINKRVSESPDGVNPSTKMVLENKPETEREWMARMKQEHGAVKVTKDKRTGILHATVKGKTVGKYDGNQMDMFGESKKR